MAPRKATRRTALAPADVNSTSAAPTDAAHSEVSMLKEQNEALKAEMASLTAKLSDISMTTASENVPPPRPTPAVAPVPTVPEPNYSLIKMPQHPTKPTNAYVHYCNTVRPTLPGGVAEQAKVMGAKWKVMTEEEKKPFVTAASADRARFDKEMKTYQAELARVELQKSSLAKMYESKKTAVALEFYEQAAAAASRDPQHSNTSTATSTTGRQSPKKNKTAYAFFCADRREAMSSKAKKGETLKLGEQQKLFAAEWSRLQNTKTGQKKIAKYNVMAAKDKTRYSDELEEHKRLREQDIIQQRLAAQKQLEAETKIAMKTFAPQVKAEAAAAEKLQEARQLKRERKAQKELEPKRPRGAYILFCMGERDAIVESMPGEPTQPEIMSELGKRWRVATPEQKGKYEAQAEADRQRYEREMDEHKRSTATD